MRSPGAPVTAWAAFTGCRSQSLVEQIRLAPGLEPVYRLVLQLMLTESTWYLVACLRTRILVRE
jgi:hypothetical protein